jgi:type II restriction/modification system DNA methylase subunit YeeA
MPEFIVPGEDDASVFPEEFTPEKIRERQERQYQELIRQLDESERLTPEE